MSLSPSSKRVVSSAARTRNSVARSYPGGAPRVWPSAVRAASRSSTETAGAGGMRAVDGPWCSARSAVIIVSPPTACWSSPDPAIPAMRFCGHRAAIDAAHGSWRAAAIWRQRGTCSEGVVATIAAARFLQAVSCSARDQLTRIRSRARSNCTAPITSSPAVSASLAAS